jgi:hypothetical protein
LLLLSSGMIEEIGYCENKGSVEVKLIVESKSKRIELIDRVK